MTKSAPRALVGIGQLAREDRVELRLGHAGALQHAGALDGFGGADHRHLVDAALAAGLEQQRHVEHDERRGGMVAQERGALLAYRRVDDRFEQLHRLGLAQHRLGKRGAVYPRRSGCSRKRRLDRRDDATRRSL